MARIYPYPAGIMDYDFDRLLDWGELECYVKRHGWAKLSRGGPTRRSNRRSIATPVRAVLDKVGTLSKPFTIHGRTRPYPGLSLGGMQAVGYQWTHKLRIPSA